MKKRLLLGIVSIALVAASCSGGGNPNPSGSTGGSPAGAIKEGGILHLGAFDGIDSMNPYVGQNDDTYSAFMYIYPYLVQYRSSDLTIIPDFATSWSHSSDGLTWTFHTRANAKWSDGQPLTSADVAFSYNTDIKYRNGPTASAASSISNLLHADAPNPTTVVLHYSRPVPDVLANAQQTAILPAHVWGKYATGDGKALKTYPNIPQNGQPVVAGGPFMVTKYEQNGTTLFLKNPNYYGTPAHIDGFGLEVFSNEDAEVTALKTGQIDAIENVPVTSVTTLKQAGFHVYIGPGLTYRTFIINTNPNKTTHPELQNPLVRQAFEYAVDRNRIVQTAWLGYAQPGSTIVPPSTGKWHDPNIHPLPFSIAKANAILDQLGYQRGPGGIRIAFGQPMEYKVVFPTNSERGAGDQAFQILQSDFAKIGVKLIQVPTGAAFSAITAPNNTYTQFDMAMWNWTPPIDPDFVLSVLTCAQFGGWSDSGYCNPAYDKLFQEQHNTLDPQKRLQIVYQMQQMAYNQRPYIVMVYNETIDAWNSNWTGFVQSIQGLFPFLSKESLTSVHQV